MTFATPDRPIDTAKSQFLKKFNLLLNDQLKRKEIIYQIQQIAAKKQLQLSNKPYISNESFKFEWFIATDEPTLIDSLYYLYFWVLLKGKYLLDDVDEEQVNKLRRKKSMFQMSSTGVGGSIGPGGDINDGDSPNGSNDSLYLDPSSSKISSIANHHSTTRFEKDILKAKKSVGDLRSQFAKIIDAESKDASNSLPVPKNGGSNSSINNFSITPRKTSWSSNSAAYTSGTSPSNPSKKYPINNNNNTNSSNTTAGNIPSHRGLVHKVSELNLMDSPFIKNVLKFKFEMSMYINVLVNLYDLNNHIVSLDMLINPNFLPPSKILLKNKTEMNLDITSRILGYEYMLFIADNPIENGNSHLHFVHDLLINHFKSGLVWDLHSVYQNSGNLKSDVCNLPGDRVSLFTNFNKILINLIYEFYPERNQREAKLKEFNSNVKHHIKITNLKLNYTMTKFSETWKSWNELDFICLNNMIVDVPESNDPGAQRLIQKRAEFKSLKQGESMTFYAWDEENNQKIELQYTKP